MLSPRPLVSGKLSVRDVGLKMLSRKDLAEAFGEPSNRTVEIDRYRKRPACPRVVYRRFSA